MIRTIEDFIAEFKRIKNRGWIPTNRSGNTGIGKTLEDLLGIEENNFATADFGGYELKAQRADAFSMLTLFTKSPDPRGANTKLREEFGYASGAYGNNRKVLHATLSTSRFVPIATTGRSLKVEIDDTALRIVSERGDTGVYWPLRVIEQKITEKYQQKLVYVTALSRGTGWNEEFLFNSAIAVENITFESIMRMFSQDKVVLDIRIGQYPDGRTHDHGTGFRLKQSHFTEMFQTNRVLG